MSGGGGGAGGVGVLSNLVSELAKIMDGMEKQNKSTKVASRPHVPQEEAKHRKQMVSCTFAQPVFVFAALYMPSLPAVYQVNYYGGP